MTDPGPRESGGFRPDYPMMLADTGSRTLHGGEQSREDRPFGTKHVYNGNSRQRGRHKSAVRGLVGQVVAWRLSQIAFVTHDLDMRQSWVAPTHAIQAQAA